MSGVASPPGGSVMLSVSVQDFSKTFEHRVPPGNAGQVVEVGVLLASAVASGTVRTPPTAAAAARALSRPGLPLPSRSRIQSSSAQRTIRAAGNRFRNDCAIAKSDVRLIAATAAWPVISRMVAAVANPSAMQIVSSGAAEPSGSPNG
jgi:hypothetical protein